MVTVMTWLGTIQCNCTELMTLICCVVYHMPVGGSATDCNNITNDSSLTYNSAFIWYTIWKQTILAMHIHFVISAVSTSTIRRKHVCMHAAFHDNINRFIFILLFQIRCNRCRISVSSMGYFHIIQKWWELERR